MRFHHNNSDGATLSRQRRRCKVSGRGRHIRLIMLGAAVVFTVASFVSMFSVQNNIAYARDYDAEIQALQNQIDDYNKRSSELAAQADTLQGKISQLQNQQAEIQAQIDLSSAEKAQLEAQIAEAEAKIKSQAEVLSKNLQDQYYSSQTSALDVLMNSDSVSDYVDRQTRQQAMSDQITSAVNDIKQAKKDLESKKSEVEKVIDRQNAQKADLADTQAEQQDLLEQTQGQESKYQELIGQNNEKIKQLRKEQAEEIARRLQAAGSGSTIYYNNGATCGGGYPAYLCNAAQDSLVDPWGMYNRECVSYAAFKVASTYGWPNYWTRGGNNANQWPGKADRYGIPRGTTPKVGSVAVMMSGYYGHVAWVEEVNGDGTIVVSDYNSDYNGHYARYKTRASAFDTYIYFDQS